MADGNGKVGLKDRIKEGTDKLWSSQVAESIMRPGSPFKQGYSDSPRNRSYVVMNNVLYHLHPVKVKRHGVKLSYTLCLGGLSFFLFILLTITGIFLMFYYTPTAEFAYRDIEALSTQVAFGSLVRNMHRWGAHLMVLSVFLHMSRVFYHGAYKPPREFNWVVGVILLLLTLLLSFSGYLLPWDQLALWAVTVGTNMAGFVPVVGEQVKFALLAGVEVSAATLLRFYVLHVLALPLHHRRCSWPSTSGGSAKTAESRDLYRRQSMVEIPESLLRRSAEAKAKALGVPVEQVLAEMKGEGPPVEIPQNEPERQQPSRCRPNSVTMPGACRGGPRCRGRGSRDAGDRGRHGAGRRPGRAQGGRVPTGRRSSPTPTTPAAPTSFG